MEKDAPQRITIKLTCPHCERSYSMDAGGLSRLIGVEYAKRKKHHTGGVGGGGRPRKIPHEPGNTKCLCVDCRRKKGYLPPRKTKRRP